MILTKSKDSLQAAIASGAKNFFRAFLARKQLKIQMCVQSSIKKRKVVLNQIFMIAAESSLADNLFFWMSWSERISNPRSLCHHTEGWLLHIFIDHEEEIDNAQLFSACIIIPWLHQLLLLDDFHNRSFKVRLIIFATNFPSDQPLHNGFNN